MKEEIRIDPVLSPRPATLRRISWQAIFAGLIVTLAVQLLLTVLGLSIGATVINPMTQQNPGEGAGLATGIWLIVITIISLFVGGWVSGRLSGLGRTSEGTLHGLVTWGAATLVTVYLLTSTVGGALGGMGKLFSQMAPTAGQMTGGSADWKNSMGFAMNNGWNSIRQEAQNIAQKNGATPTGRTTGTPAGQEQGASAQLVSALDRMFSHGDNINASDREAVVNLLVTQDNMSQADATQTVDRWIQTYQQSKAQTGQKARQAGQMVSQGISVAGWGSFIALALGAIAAAWGGSRGTLAFLRSREEMIAAV